MIKRFITQFDDKRKELRDKISQRHPENYEELLKMVIETINDEEEGFEPTPDPDRIHRIDDGDYQGTLVFIIAENIYQPDRYWYTMVAYGSCSGCDTLQGISNYDDDPPSKQQTDDYMTLALHMLQNMKELFDD